MRVEFNIEADVDEAALQDHVARWGDQRYPIVADPSEFAWVDLQAAVSEEFVLDPEITGFTILSEPV
jgi:hypothetical protein